MRQVRGLVPILAGMLLLLTYLLVQGSTPDAARHESTLDALRTVILNDAALQRDVLKARAGLLRNYDPLVSSIDRLRNAVAILRTTARAADEPARSEIERHTQRLATAVDDQEALLEAFKSRNALLQNSLTFLHHMSRHLGADSEPAVVAEIGSLANALLRFTSDPRDEPAAALTASLDRLSRMATSPDLGRDIRATVAHGGLVVATLPQVDDLVSRLLASPAPERARALQDAYLGVQERLAARADLFRILLYIASIGLVTYIGYLFIRLHANARVLRTRLRFERLVAAISTHFVNLPRDRIGEGVDDGLARLGEHAAADRAQITVRHAEDGRSATCRWHREGAPAPMLERDDLLAVAALGSAAGYERQGCIFIADVRRLPPDPASARLQELGTRSLLCIPMRHTGRPVGFVTLETTHAVARWRDEDIALLRTGGEILVNVIEHERGETQRQALEGRLLQAQRLEAIGILAGGIAHEFNNILGAILGYGEMAMAALPRDSPVQRHVRGILQAGQRAQGVAEQILAFGRRSERRYRSVSAQRAVAEAVDLLRASLPATIEVRTRLAADGAAVLGDPGQLQQVLVNLGANGAQAMDGRGALEIALDAIAIADETTLSHGSLAPGRYVRLTVRDTGHGMDAATMERIFEPFFTTKAAGKGTGLGLATVHGIVAQHGGGLNVLSQPDAGSTFEAYFPQTSAPVVDEGRAEAQPPQGKGQTVLLVDDDKPLVVLGEEMLAALGYEPVGFVSGATALTAFHADPGRFDLVLADEVMPGMTGTELAGRLHRVRPELPIVLMTGYGGPVPWHRLHTAGIRDVIKKPLLSTPLANCLARHLAARERSGPQVR
jgi:signal transduction histidine kinase